MPATNFWNNGNTRRNEPEESNKEESKMVKNQKKRVKTEEDQAS
jgi:hypothetical protein